MKPNNKWAPKYYTEAESPKSMLPLIEKLCEMIKARDGAEAGKIIKLREWQKWALSQITALDNNNNLRYSKFVLLIPRKNGKTFIAAILIILHLLTAPSHAEIYSAGKDRSQAEIVYKMVKNFIEESPFLSSFFKISKTTKTIENSKSKAFYQPLSSDSGSIHGKNPYFVVADEIHIWEGQGTSTKARDFWEGLVSGSGARNSSQIFVISTAGSNVDTSLLGSLYKYGIDVCKGNMPDNTFGFICWEADEEDDIKDFDTWKKANPNLSEGFINKDFMLSSLKSAASTGITQFLRLHLNIWASQKGDPFIIKSKWKDIEKKGYKIPIGANVTVGFDGSLTGDTTAIIIQEISTGFLQIYKIWEEDVTDKEWRVDRDEVRDAIGELSEYYNILLMWADASYWEADIRKWEKDLPFTVTIVPPTLSRMTPIANDFLKDISEKVIGHGGDKKLDEYCFRAIRREDGGFGKISKKREDRIDLLVASILANGARNWVKDNPVKTYKKAKAIAF